MEGRDIWSARDVEECWRVTGAPSVSDGWIDTDKGSWVNGAWVPLVRSRLVARDFKGLDRGRDDLFAETPLLDCKRIVSSPAATRRKDERWRKMMSVDARNAYIHGICEDDVCIELPEECGLGLGQC